MRQFRMIAACCLLCLLAMGQRLLGQSNCSYLIISTGTYTQAQIDQAFTQASLDSYRFKNARRTMTFTNGAEVQLYSATELQSQGCPVDGTQAMPDNTPLDPARRYEILTGGVIYEPVQAVYKH